MHAGPTKHQLSMEWWKPCKKTRNPGDDGATYLDKKNESPQLGLNIENTPHKNTRPNIYGIFQMIHVFKFSYQPGIFSEGCWHQMVWRKGHRVASKAKTVWLFLGSFGICINIPNSSPMGKTVFFFRKKNMWFPENSKIYKKKKNSSSSLNHLKTTQNDLYIRKKF